MLKRRTPVMFSVLIGLVVSLLLTACGGETATPPSGQSNVNLTVWAMGAEGENLKVLAQDFEQKNPNIKIKIQAIPWGDAHTKLITSVAGNQTPDITQLGTTWMAEFAQMGVLDSPPASISPDAFFKGAWETAMVNGQVYGVPWYIDTRVMFYRTDILEKAGITAPPTTWDELKTAAKAMQEKAGTKYGIYLPPKATDTLIPFIWQNGAQLMEGNKYNLDNPQVVEALTFYQSFFKEGLTHPQPPTDFDVTQNFVQGDVPIFFSGPWNVGMVLEQGGTQLEGKWALAPMPGKVSNTSFLGGSNLAVFKNSPNREAAWKFVSYLSQPDVQVKWYDTVKDLPSVQEAWNSGSLAGDKNLAVFHTQMSAAQGTPNVTKWEEVDGVIANEMEQVMLGKMTPEQAATSMQQKATGIGTGQ